jgi:KipI family sensor histidine kinase inhibitor
MKPATARHTAPSGVRLLPSGDRCLVVEFGERIELAVNRRACAFARVLADAALPGVTDIVPSYAAVAVHYQPELVPRQDDDLPLAALSRLVQDLLADSVDDDAEPARLVEIPVCYGGRHGPDLDDVAQACGLARDEVVRLHTAAAGHVFMLGFAPGHPYIGLWDRRLALPRRSSPRTRVPAGSVALANRQSVIYPFESPGGWHLIGRTPLAMFDITRDPPCLLQPGDSVRFVEIAAAQFDAMARGGA